MKSHTIARFRYLSGPRLLLCILLTVLSLQIAAQGDLMVTPRRVVFEGGKNRQEITLANTGNDTARYTISFVQYRMKDDGSIEQITEPDPGQWFADSFIRYFPRTFTLPPKESQVLKMQMNPGSSMAEGEYRSHLYFRAVPQEKPLGDDELTIDTAAIGIRLTPIYGITIPVIIRTGNTNATVTLTDAKIHTDTAGTNWMTITFNRQGNSSVYGDLFVDYIAPNGSSQEAGVVRGIAVYTPNQVRHFTFALKQTGSGAYTGGKLAIRYSSSSEAKQEVFARTEITPGK